MSLSSVSSMATPTICNPSGPYFFCRSISHGISILHGPHQVAQKFSSTAFPRKDASEMLLPSGMLFSSNPGAMEPFGGSPGPWTRVGADAWLPATEALADSDGLLARLPT